MEAAGHHYRDGAWSSPGYRSARMRANITLALFVVVGVASLGLVSTSLESYGLVRRAGSGSISDVQALDVLIEETEAVSAVFVLAAFTLAVAFLAWLSRTVEITPALGGGTPSTSPAWSIIWWFIPIAFLWKPYSVVREVWERLATPERRGNGWVVVGWWLCWIGGGVLGRASDVMARTGTDWEALETAMLLGVGSSVASLVAAILGFFLVRELQARADLRALALGFEAPLPSAARPQPDQSLADIRAQERTSIADTVDAPSRSRVSGATADLAASLHRLRVLRDEGLITDEEYERKRSEILDRL